MDFFYFFLKTYIEKNYFIAKVEIILFFDYIIIKREKLLMDQLSFFFFFLMFTCQTYIVNNTRSIFMIFK